MNRLLLDTNIYGLLMADKDFHLLHTKIENIKEDLKIYGFSIIRSELKQAPKETIQGVNIRASLLRAYSSFIVKEYELQDDLKGIAEDYHKTYLEFGGSLPKDKLFNDFLIVACSSVKDISVVVSEDNATLASEIAKKAYRAVNKKRNIAFPNFTGYEDFKKIVLGASLPDPIIKNSNKLGILLGFFNIFPGIYFVFNNFIFHTMNWENLYINVSFK